MRCGIALLLSIPAFSTTVIAIRTPTYVLLAADGLASGVPADQSRVCKLRKVHRTIGDPLWYSMAGPAHPQFLTLVDSGLRQCGGDIDACLTDTFTRLENSTDLANRLHKGMGDGEFIRIVVTDSRHIHLLTIQHRAGRFTSEIDSSLKFIKRQFIFGEVSAFENWIAPMKGAWPDIPQASASLVREILGAQIKATPRAVNHPVAILLLSGKSTEWIEKGACNE